MSDLEERLENWQGAGLISADQADAISIFEAQAERRRVSLREIFVYLGGFFVLLAVGFGLQALWDDLSSFSRVLIVAVPTLILWAAGEGLRRRDDPTLLRGAKVCWMVAAWLSAIVVAVILNEWPGLDMEPEWLVTWSSLGGLALAVAALLILPGFPQGLATTVLGAIFALSLFTVVIEAWGQEARWAQYLPAFVIGSISLGAAELARRHKQENLIWLFNLFGALMWLFWAFIIGQQGKLLAWETLLLVESLAFVGWSVVRQSQVLLYSGAVFLLVYIVNLNFEYFEDRLGLPAVLLITGVALIAVGLGVDRLRRLESPASSE